MRRLVRLIVTLTALGAGAVVYLRRNPRFGTHLLNDVVNPFLMRQGVSRAEGTELATLEHTGRRTGMSHLALVHPVTSGGGFRIAVPLAASSEWARNVVAAGHCRMSMGETVYRLDEPRWIEPGEVVELPAAVRLLERALGLRYLWLHRLGEAPGTLEPIAVETEVAVAPSVTEPPVAEEPVPALT